ncbi:MAG: diacylglycerol kinase family lipid kinase [Bacteroidetes bacterium]|jgi:YegS/Rv2252/BmrU family lipid kinase|nr:diacylglycerol kinase family lipid kinase [Bacteroidota bacterium]
MRPVGERVVKFIVNPVSGNGRTRRLLPHLIKIAKRLGIEFDLQLTQAPEHATELASNSSGEFDVVVAVGGDGTINEVAAGAIKSQKAMGVVPSGTGNDFVRSMGRLKHLHDYLHRAVAGRAKLIDVGSLQVEGKDMLFVNGVGVGFDAEVARESLNLTKLKGLSRYLYAVIRTLSKYNASEMQIELDGQIIKGRTFLVAIGNGISAGGGFLLTPDAKLDDGLLDTCIVSDVSFSRVLQVIPSVLRGTHARHKEVSMNRAGTIRIESEHPVAIHRDGEIPADKATRISIEVRPQALKIMS